MKLKTKFQDEDFGFGEVVDASIMYGYGDKIEVCGGEKMKHRKYNSIKDFTDHWEDAPEEPKEYWYINSDSVIYATDCGKYPDSDLLREAIGNYFETEEEAEKAVEKLMAWKRLKDAGLKFSHWDGYVEAGDSIESGDHFDCCGFVNTYGQIYNNQDSYEQYRKDLDLLFNNDNDGGEE